MGLIYHLALAADVFFVWSALVIASWRPDFRCIAGLFRLPRWQEFLKAAAIWGLLLFVSWAFAHWGRVVYPRVGSLLWGLAIGPLYEEVARAATISTLRRFWHGRCGLAIAVAVSAVIFVLRHFGWGSMLTPPYGCFLALYGIAIGVIYARTRSIPFTFAFHSLWNVTAYLFILR